MNVIMIIKKVMLIVIICVVGMLKISDKQPENKNINQLENLKPGYKILCQSKSEFGDNNYRYIGVIFENDDERVLYFLKEYKDGTYKILVKNKDAIFKKDEGGVFGDPFENMLLKEDNLIISLYGGSNWRWQYVFTFKINDESIVLQKCRYAFKSLEDCEIGSDEIIKDGGVIKYYYPAEGILESVKMNQDILEKKEDKLEKKEIELKEYDIYSVSDILVNQL